VQTNHPLQLCRTLPLMASEFSLVCSVQRISCVCHAGCENPLDACPDGESWDGNLLRMAGMGNIVRKVRHILNKILSAVAAGRAQADHREISAVR
jgi:hypothetical protein